MHRHGGGRIHSCRDPRTCCAGFGVSTDRAGLRRLMRQRRREVRPPARIGAADARALQLRALPPRPGAKVAGYWAADGEIALHAWQLRLPREVEYCLPLLNADGRLRFAPWRAGDPIAPNRHGIPEPVVGDDALLEPDALDLVVVPL